ncbi:MAG TPA: sulfatase-like hydrolase/transferase, partial [Leptospiraceae bacterium]|nr:sulfatase-like hydrolase/transferase [Leptospiraceae bacterium]
AFIKNIFQNTGIAFKYSLSLYLICLIFNTSFRVMGFDLSSEINSILNGDFFVLILLINAKILLIYYIFFSVIQISLDFLINELSKGKDSWIQKRKRSLIYLVFILFTLSLFFHSIIHYPQVYGEFFYIRHTYLQPLLYFLTDYVNPKVFEFFFLGFIAIYLSFLFVGFIYKSDIRYLFYLSFFLLIIFFHVISFVYGIIPIFLSFQIIRQIKTNVNRFLLLPTLFLITLIIGSYYYFTFLFHIPKESSKDFNLLIVSADSLRADRIGAKVNGISITPNIDKFKEEAFTFEDHHVTIPRTFPSWADLLSGEYSMSHKIRDMFPAPEEKKNLGSPEFPTIGHYLQKKKYKTAVFSNFAGDIFTRADFGFQEVHTPNFNAKILVIQKNLEFQVFLLPILTGSFLRGGNYFEEINGFSNLGDGDRILPDIYSFIRREKSNPFFLNVFFSVTHFPYSPPYPDYKKFTDPKYYGKYKYFKFVDPTSDSKPDEKDIEQIKAIFDASVYSFDESFGKLIKYLKKHSLYEKTLIVITGDHGESLYEDIHGHGHGEHLRGPYITQVPLIIKFPHTFYKERGTHIFKGISSSIDLVPTLIDFFQIDANKNFPGQSLIPILGKENWDEERFVYSETGIWFSDIGDHFFQSQRIMYPSILKMHRIVPEEEHQIMITDPYFRETIAFAKHRALITSKYKFIYIPTRDGVIYELFDRVNDPLNQNNIADMNPYIVEQMKRNLYKLAEEKEGANIIGDYILPPPINKD